MSVRAERTPGPGSLPFKIVQVGDRVLRERAGALTREQIRSSEIQELIEHMRTAMYDAPGVGLAAPQIGLPLQLAVIEDKSEYTKDAPQQFLKERDRRPVPFHVIANPKLIVTDETPAEFFEGCLSVAGFMAVVARARRVRVECLDHRGEEKVIDASGWYARILQHEIDHLGGVVYLDRMKTRTFMTVDNFNRHWKDKPMEKVRELLEVE